MVITDDFEHSRKSLFPVPYDQYDIWQSIFAIAAITQNKRFKTLSTQWLNIVQFQFKIISVYRYLVLLFQITGLLTFVQFVVIRQPRRGGNNDGNMAYIASF